MPIYHLFDGYSRMGIAENKCRSCSSIETEIYEHLFSRRSAQCYNRLTYLEEETFLELLEGSRFGVDNKKNWSKLVKI